MPLAYCAVDGQGANHFWMCYSLTIYLVLVVDNCFYRFGETIHMIQKHQSLNHTTFLYGATAPTGTAQPLPLMFEAFEGLF